ncbi:MAG: hypothetical protein J2O46_01720, partial [Nocardioides sp.]|nr:hypothetical protein [Nocardioides sp.]
MSKDPADKLSAPSLFGKKKPKKDGRPQDPRSAQPGRPAQGAPAPRSARGGTQQPRPQGQDASPPQRPARGGGPGAPGAPAQRPVRGGTPQPGS